MCAKLVPVLLVYVSQHTSEAAAKAHNYAQIRDTSTHKLDPLLRSHSKTFVWCSHFLKSVKRKTFVFNL